MKKMIKFFKDLATDYRNSSKYQRKMKRKCYWKILRLLFSYLWSIISAPFIYPIWYYFRNKITANYQNNKIWYWLYTYGDLNDPLNRGGLPLDYKGGKNTFKNRWFYSAIRNPRFTYNVLKYNTESILWERIIIDDRNWNIMISSYGVGDSPKGIIFKWLYSDCKAYFIYENNTEENVFWFGWVGLLKDSINKTGRFEMAYRIKKQVS